MPSTGWRSRCSPAVTSGSSRTCWTPPVGAPWCRRSPRRPSNRSWSRRPRPRPRRGRRSSGRTAGSPSGAISSVRALVVRRRHRTLRVHAFEALTDRRDVQRQVLERLDGARGEREREVVALLFGARPRDLGAPTRSTGRLRPRLLVALRTGEQVAQHPLRQLEELARVRPVGGHPFPSRLTSSIDGATNLRPPPAPAAVAGGGP